MITNKFKNHLIQELNKSEEYMYETFMYLKELEIINPKDSKLQKAIWDLCEAGELVSRTAIELECTD